MSYLIELTPKALVYLQKRLDNTAIAVSPDDVIEHAQIKQQLLQPQDAEKLVEQLKAQGAHEAEQRRATEPPPPPPQAFGK